MSHFKAYDVNVDNEQYLISALQDMQLEAIKNCTIVDWAKQNRQVDLGVSKDGKLLPLGFVMNQQKGKYDVMADWYMLPWSEKQFTEKVSQLHSKHRVKDICLENRWMVNDEDISINQNGEIEMIATQWS